MDGDLRNSSATMITVLRDDMSYRETGRGGIPAGQCDVTSGDVSNHAGAPEATFLLMRPLKSLGDMDAAHGAGQRDSARPGRTSRGVL